MSGRGRAEPRRARAARVCGALAVAAALAAALGCGGDGGAPVRFLAPGAPGPAPFTSPADVPGPTTVATEPLATAEGPVGGTGSNRVCDRVRLLRLLTARPDRLRAFARVAGVAPTAAALTAYVRRLEPVTVTRAARFTDHALRAGQGEPFQAVLAPGTAALARGPAVVVRCHSGSPLTAASADAAGECLGCPPGYEPPAPAPCRPDACHAPYPTGGAAPPPAREPEASPPVRRDGGAGERPRARWNRDDGTTDDVYSLLISGFAPDAALDVSLRNPDGTMQQKVVTTDRRGRATYWFSAMLPGSPPGFFVARVRNPQTGAEVSARTRFSGDAAGDVD